VRTRADYNHRDEDFSWEDNMKAASGIASRLFALFLLCVLLTSFCGILAAEQLPLKRAVELALTHSTTMQASQIDEQRAFASYHEVRNQYLPQLTVG
jgi:outer membrane protein TolC